MASMTTAPKDDTELEAAVSALIAADYGFNERIGKPEELARAIIAEVKNALARS